MSRPGNDRGRPLAGATSDVVGDSDSSIVTTSTDVPRCTRCGHQVWSPESIRIGIGRDCRRREAA